jgi:hypothetical protein
LDAAVVGLLQDLRNILLTWVANFPMVKIVLTACLSLLCLGSMAQLNGKVVEATKTPIQGRGKESLGSLIAIEGLHSYVFLKKCDQSCDSSGIYRTVFEFGNPNRIKAYQIAIILQFDKMADSVIFTTEGEPRDLKTSIAPNKLGASYQASELSPSGTITATVISKKKIFTSITGVEGQLH